jgi:hypothetical protein
MQGSVFTQSLIQENGIISGKGAEDGTALHQTGPVISDIARYITGQEIDIIKDYPIRWSFGLLSRYL